MKVGRLIHRDLPRYKPYVKINITIGNRNKIKIEVNSCDYANKLIEEKILIDNSYSPYIPKYFTTKSGLIKNIPLDTTKDEPTDSDEEIYNQLWLNIQQAAISSTPIPKSNKHIDKTPPIWWDNECTIADQERKYTKCINYLNYKKSDCLVKRLFKYKKRTKWKAVCTSINKDAPNNKIWKQIKLLKNIPLTYNSGTDHLIEEFADIIRNASSTPSVESKINYEDECSSDFFSNAVTCNEFTNALNSKKDSSPGLDNII